MSKSPMPAIWATSAISLSKVIAPLGKCGSILFVLDQVSAVAVRWKQPFLRLGGVQHSPNPHYTHETPNHCPRQRDVERLLLASLWLGNVRDSRSKANVFDHCALQRVGRLPTKVEISETLCGRDCRALRAHQSKLLVRRGQGPCCAAFRNSNRQPSRDFRQEASVRFCGRGYRLMALKLRMHPLAM